MNSAYGPHVWACRESVIQAIRPNALEVNESERRLCGGTMYSSDCDVGRVRRIRLARKLRRNRQRSKGYWLIAGTSVKQCSTVENACVPRCSGYYMGKGQHGHLRSLIGVPEDVCDVETSWSTENDADVDFTSNAGAE